MQNQFWTWECKYYAQKAIECLEAARKQSDRSEQIKYMNEAAMLRKSAMNFAKRRRA